VRRFHRGKPWTPHRELIYSRLITALWGAVTLVMAFYVGDIATTVLEAINQIGSLANGSILAVFALGLLTRHTHGPAARAGLALGILANALLWLFAPQLSWLWWNVIGFAVTFLVGAALGRWRRQDRPLAAEATSEASIPGYLAREARVNWTQRSLWLVLWFGFLLVFLGWFGVSIGIS